MSPRPIRRVGLLAATAGVATLLARCGAAARTMIDPTDTRCPGNIPATVGRRFTCHFTGPEGPYTVYLRILRVNGRRVDYRLESQRSSRPAPTLPGAEVVLLLVTRASGVGKSTVRGRVQPALAPGVECVELDDLAPVPPVVSKAWRQQTAETAVRRAIELQATDPLHIVHVVSDAGWELMRWDRLQAVSADWRTTTIDTTDMSRADVAEAVLDWCRRALTGDAPTFAVANS